MTKTDTRNVKATLTQIRDLAEHGCEIVRVAVPDVQAAQAISTIRKNATIPIIADIHFDYRLALEALKSGADGLRLNPGNISDSDQITKVVQAAKQRDVPIRIGVNAGGLPPTPKPSAPLSQRMVGAVLQQVSLLENLDFRLIKVSLKAFDVPTTVDAYTAIAKKIPYPLHLGITEAGVQKSGIIRSALGIGILLHQGIGDTIRVSLSADPATEVDTAYEILKGLDLRHRGPTLVSCPSCGRAEVDIIGLAESVDKSLKEIGKSVKIAVMGCIVNGPGEAKDADVGIACGKGNGVIFRKGRIVRTVVEKEFLDALMSEVKSL
jgi:(E)-4-hydroxy-3-methylbut-2-enyl-diphosphate synthase